MPRANPRADLEPYHEALESLTKDLDRLTKPPFHPAEFLERLGDCHAMVICGGHLRAVSVRDGVSVTGLAPGDEVLLNEPRNCMVGRVGTRRGSGELAEFERALGADRAIVRLRDAATVVQIPATLRASHLRRGDLLRVSHGFALEKVEHVEPELPPDDPTDVTPASVGGQDECIKRLIRAATALLIEPARAARYGLGKKGRTILLSGPPGCGKTLMVGALKNEVKRLSGRPCVFVAIKPGDFDRMHVGESERHIRSTFDSLGAAAARDGQALLYLDELDGIGPVRGGQHSNNVHGDRSTSCLLACIEGVKPIGNVLIVSSCNALDRVDPALLERLSGVHIRVGRPGFRAAREILQIHLPITLPFSPNGASAPRTREELIDAAAARLCGPHAEVICTLRFKNGKEEILNAARFLSGRLLQQICVDASESAFYAEPDRDEPGVQLGDVLDAVEAAVDRLRAAATSNNIRALVDGLPEDQAIAAVEPVKRKIKRAHRFLNP